jgi:hypothetical protein
MAEKCRPEKEQPFAPETALSQTDVMLLRLLLPHKRFGFGPLFFATDSPRSREAPTKVGH